MKPFRSRALTLRGQVLVRAGLDEAFELFSPEGERWWVPGWDPEYLHPADGAWERGQLFRTREESGEAVWVVSGLDRSGHRSEYHRVEPGHWVARVEVGCRAAQDGATEVTVAYSFFGLSEAGNREIATMNQADYDAKMERWGRWLEDYLSDAEADG